MVPFNERSWIMVVLTFILLGKKDQGAFRFFGFS